MLGLSLDGFVPQVHPLRRIKSLVDTALARMSPVFEELCTAGVALYPARAPAQGKPVDGVPQDPLEREIYEQLRHNIPFK